MRPFVLLLAALAAEAAAAQDFPPAVRRYIQTELQPHARAYERCAEQHLRERAAAAPHSTFDAHEASIKPACGQHIRTIIAGVINAGQSESAAIDLVNDYYRYLQPKLREAFETQTALRRSELEIAAAREREKQLMSAEQLKLMDEEIMNLSDCLKAKALDLVVYSDEKAETLADAAVISCSAHYQKMRSLFVAFFGSGGNDLDTAIRTRAAGDRRYIAAIVAAIRAEVAKRAGPPGRAGEPAPSPEGEGRLY